MKPLATCLNDNWWSFFSRILYTSTTYTNIHNGWLRKWYRCKTFSALFTSSSAPPCGHKNLSFENIKLLCYLFGRPWFLGSKYSSRNILVEFMTLTQSFFICKGSIYSSHNIIKSQKQHRCFDITNSFQFWSSTSVSLNTWENIYFSIFKSRSELALSAIMKEAAADLSSLLDSLPFHCKEKHIVLWVAKWIFTCNRSTHIFTKGTSCYVHGSLCYHIWDACWSTPSHSSIESRSAIECTISLGTHAL